MLYLAMVAMREARKTAPVRAHARKTRGVRDIAKAALIACTIDMGANDFVVLSRQQYADLTAAGMRNSNLDLHCFAIAHEDVKVRVQLATGAALVLASQKARGVAVVFTRNVISSCSEPLLSLAAARRLPIIYVQTEAFVKVRSPLKHARRGSAVPIIPVDQNDIVAIYRVACEAIDKARRGVGPTIIHCVPSATGIGKVENADPILKMESYLRKKNLWSDELNERLDCEPVPM